MTANPEYYRRLTAGSICYIDHSKPVSHPYYDDHMNAHIRTAECERKEKRARDRAKKRQEKKGR